jgi:hypothetical protein
MSLEIILENLKDGYKQFVRGTFQHAYQITAARKIKLNFEDYWFCIADGNLFTVKENEVLWTITREPQNLVLQDIDNAHHQLTTQGNYFPDAQAAQASVDHKDSVTVNLNVLKLAKYSNELGYFVIDPKSVQKLNSQQKKVAQHIYGPDDENFGLNMKIFAQKEITPRVYVLLPKYVQDTLNKNNQQFLGRSSLFGSFDDNSSFYVNNSYMNVEYAMRGVRRTVASQERASEN